MSGFGESIRYNLRSLTRFSGRDRRSQFWPYAASAFVLSMVGGWTINVPMMLMGASELDRAGSVEQSMQRMVELQQRFLLVVVVWFVVLVALLAAAIVRRLHDRGMRGFWGLLPVPFVLTGFAGMTYFTRALTAPQMPDFGLFLAVFFNNVVYLVTLVFLIIHLALKGTAGPNRYGKEPSR